MDSNGSNTFNDVVGDVVGILRDHYNPREEGWMWLAVRPPGASTGVMSQIEGEAPDLPTMVTCFSAILERLAPVESLLAICRRDGRPFEKDRLLWRALRDRFDATDVQLVDMVVFGPDSTWSMRAEDARSNAVA